MDNIFVGSMVNTPSSKVVWTLKSFKISINAATSWISGTPSNTTGSDAKIAAGIKATVLFLAPLMVTSPVTGFPPLMTNFLIDSNPLITSSLPLYHAFTKRHT